MTLKHVGNIVLPAHTRPGGFDHAALHRGCRRLYVAHTANNAIDVIDCASDQYLHSIPNLAGVAGALVSVERDRVFTSNRDENTISIFAPDDEAGSVKVPVGIHPNGLAFDPLRGLLLVANVGDPARAGSFTVSLVDIVQREMVANIPVPGRTRWAIFDAMTSAFYVNIATPEQIVVVTAEQPTHIARAFAVPAAGPHGLELDTARRHLFCACDAQRLMALDVVSGKVLQEADLGGVPDVIFFNATRQHLYVAIGDPGVIEVFETEELRRIEIVPTERGAHTIGFDPDHNTVYAFLPKTHCAAIYRDEVQ